LSRLAGRAERGTLERIQLLFLGLFNGRLARFFSQLKELQGEGAAAA
jgi:hypothetical protein